MSKNKQVDIVCKCNSALSIISYKTELNIPKGSDVL